MGRCACCSLDKVGIRAWEVPPERFFGRPRLRSFACASVLLDLRETALYAPFYPDHRSLWVKCSKQQHGCQLDISPPYQDKAASDLLTIHFKAPTMNNLTLTSYNNLQPFTFREDGWINMTKAAKAFGKDLSNFMRAKETKEYLEALSEALSVNSDELNLIEIKRGGGLPPSVGTWGHPRLAVFSARWLDIKCAVFCDSVVDDLIRGSANLTVIKPDQSSAMASSREYISALEALIDAEKRRHLEAIECGGKGTATKLLTYQPHATGEITPRMD